MRCVHCFQDHLLKEGLAWLDTQAAGEPQYWLPALFSELSSRDVTPEEANQMTLWQEKCLTENLVEVKLLTKLKTVIWRTCWTLPSYIHVNLKWKNSYPNKSIYFLEQYYSKFLSQTSSISPDKCVLNLSTYFQTHALLTSLHISRQGALSCLSCRITVSHYLQVSML